MGWSDRISEYVQPDICIPAVAQGALGIECRADDSFMIELLGKLDHMETALAVRAERQYLGRLNGGCQIPIGAYAEVLAAEGGAAGDKPQLEMTVMVAAPDGSRLIKEWAKGDDPEKLGDVLADRVLEQGAESILSQLRG